MLASCLVLSLSSVQRLLGDDDMRLQWILSSALPLLLLSGSAGQAHAAALSTTTAATSSANVTNLLSELSTCAVSLFFASVCSWRPEWALMRPTAGMPLHHRSSSQLRPNRYRLPMLADQLDRAGRVMYAC